MTSTLPEAEDEERTAQIRMEESFTIHLGKMKNSSDQDGGKLYHSSR